MKDIERLQKAHEFINYFDENYEYEDMLSALTHAIEIMKRVEDSEGLEKICKWDEKCKKCGAYDLCSLNNLVCGKKIVSTLQHYLRGDVE